MLKKNLEYFIKILVRPGSDYKSVLKLCWINKSIYLTNASVPVGIIGLATH